MKAIIGLKYKVFYNENNINNIENCEIRAVVDDVMLVVLCIKKEKEFYKMIEISDFDYKARNNIIKKI